MTTNIPRSRQISHTINVPSPTGPVTTEQVNFCAGNFSVDLIGEADTRPGTWGVQGVVEQNIVFAPPAGYAVRILRVYGDFVACTRDAAPPGKKAGVLWALHTNAPDTPVWVKEENANTMLYLQMMIDGSPARAPVDFKTAEAGLLWTDNILVSKMAVWLSELGMPVHMEPSFVITYQLEPIIST